MADVLHRPFLRALLDGDRFAAFDEVARLRGAGRGLSSIYLEVFQPSLREIGRLWQVAEITVADEHLASAITQSAMAGLYRDLFDEAPSSGPTVLAACADGEHHQIGLRMVCDLLQVDGWATRYLGASVPADDLVDMVRRRNPDVLAMSASIPARLDDVRQVLSAVRAAGGRRPFLVVGGRAVGEEGAPDAPALGADLVLFDAAEAGSRLRGALAG